MWYCIMCCWILFENILRLINILYDNILRIMCLVAQSCPTLCDAMDCMQPARLLCPWGFSRQEYWNGLPCPPPGDLPNPGTEPESPASPALAGGFFTTSATWEASFYIDYVKLYSYTLQRSCLKPGAPPYKIEDYRKIST